MPDPQLSPEWRRWLLENLARGCAAQGLLDEMVEKGLEPAAARTALEAMARALAEAIEPGRAVVAPGGPSRLPPGSTIVAAGRAIRVRLRLERPALALLDDVLAPEECDELIRRAAPKLATSTIVDPAEGVFRPIADRTSEGTYFETNADPWIAGLDRRLAALAGLPVEQGEPLQILHYPPGGEYKPHFDYFPPADPGSAAALKTGGQRVATLVIYLSDVEQGGGTLFPRLGLEVVPRKGSAVWFEYADGQGRLDPRTLHAGAPVLAGEKWIATKWIRERKFG